MSEYAKYRENLSDYPTELTGLESLHYKHDLLVKNLELARLNKASIQEEVNIIADIDEVDQMIEFVESMMGLNAKEEKTTENESGEWKWADD